MLLGTLEGGFHVVELGLGCPQGHIIQNIQLQQPKKWLDWFDCPRQEWLCANNWLLKNKGGWKHSNEQIKDQQ